MIPVCSQYWESLQLFVLQHFHFSWCMIVVPWAVEGEMGMEPYYTSWKPPILFFPSFPFPSLFTPCRQPVFASWEERVSLMKEYQQYVRNTSSASEDKTVLVSFPFSSISFPFISTQHTLSTLPLPTSITGQWACPMMREGWVYHGKRKEQGLILPQLINDQGKRNASHGPPRVHLST